MGTSASAPLAPPFIYEQREAVYVYVLEHVLAETDWPDLVTLVRAQRGHQGHALTLYQAVLPVLTCVAAGGRPEVAQPVAAAWLLLALAAHIFDDLQDQDVRERPWRTWPLPKTISTGVGLVFAAQSCLAGLQAPAEAKVEISALINQSGLYAARGQREQLQPTLEAYFHEALGKSGFPLAAISQAGARTHTSEATLLKKLYNFGLSLGILMQICDDVADLSPLRPGNDLAQRRYTLPVIYALAQTHHPLQPKLLGLLNLDQPTTAIDAEAVYQILVEMDALTATLSLAAVYKEKALASLQSFPADNVVHLKTYLSHYDLSR